MDEELQSWAGQSGDDKKQVVGAQIDGASGALHSGDSVDEDSLQCPLFMSSDGLPSNFASNNALAAIAALLNDDDSNSGAEDGKKAKGESMTSKVTPIKGGGKISRRTANKSRGSHRKNPYNKPEKESKAKATIGEAQLFLKMWKI